MAYEINASVFAFGIGAANKRAFEVFIRDVGGDPYSGSLPDDVTDISIEGPSGPLEYTKADFTYVSVGQQFYLQEEGLPEEGLYTFSATIEGDTQQAQDTQAPIIEIPNATLIAPNDLDSLPAGAIDFSWDSTATGFYHRITVRDLGFIPVASSERTLDANSAQIVLSPGSYLWRLEISDSSQRVLTNTRCDTEWRSLTII